MKQMNLLKNNKKYLIIHKEWKTELTEKNKIINFTKIERIIEDN